MITLYVFGPYFGLPDPSHFVMKTEIQLKMAGLTYQKDATGFPSAPKGKLPYIDDDGEKVADSTFIRAHIERKYGIDLDAALGARERAEAWAIERLLEDHLGWTMAYTRWLVPENFAKGPAQFFEKAPPELRQTLKNDALARVKTAQWGHGMGRHAPNEVGELAELSLSALSALLGDRAFLGGERPIGVDATAAATLACVLTPAFNSPVSRAARRHANLIAYTDRMMRRFYTAEEYRPEKAEAEKAIA
jgi:glutathione S-transferase